MFFWWTFRQNSRKRPPKFIKAVHDVWNYQQTELLQYIIIIFMDFFEIAGNINILFW